MSNGVKEFLVNTLIEQITRLSEYCSETEDTDFDAETLLSQLIELAFNWG